MSSKNKNQDLPNQDLPGFDTQILQAEKRTELAETRTEQAKSRIEQAETRTEAAEMRTEQAKTRTEQAESRTEAAETRTEAAEMRSVLAIHTSELGYRRLFETAPDGILILDADTGQVVDANPFMKELLGYSQEEFLGKKLWEIGPFKGEAASKITFAELQLKDRIRYEGLPLETKDGRRVEVEFISNAYLVDKKKLIQCNIRDITERKRTEEALSQSESRLKTIVENLSEGLAISDLKGQFTHFNRAALQMHDFASQKESRRHVSEFVDTFELSDMDGKIWPVEQWPISRLLRGEKLRNLEVRIRRIHSDWQRVLSYGGTLILDTDGQPMMAVITIMDITERSKSEEEIRRLNAELEQRVVERTAQLEAANEELGTFSYSVSHDLRAPLRHVMGFVELLQKDAGTLLPEKSLQHLNTIFQATKRMGDLIDDLLDFSRIGQSKMQKTEVNLAEVVQDTLADFQADTKERTIVWEIHPLPSVQGDRALLRMVLVNLISNAVKFTSQRAEARIEIGCAAGENDETVIFIRDNGAGFDPQYVEKLFGVFQRLHNQSEFEGTGIGLANVQRIIHRHGGRTWAEGIVDGGATFYFCIPKSSGDICEH